MKKLSAEGANLSIPEMTAKARRNHGKHLRPGKSFAGMSMTDYVQRGVDFARTPVGGNVIGYRGEDGCIVRFNEVTGEWVKAYKTGVASYMKPSAGKTYYEKWFELDKGETSDE
jgi:hypothetical protein